MLARLITVCLAVFAAAHAVPATSQESSERVALVVGNGAYSPAPALPNPSNDARDVSALLRSLGFEVIEGIDLDRREFVAAVGNFLGRAASAEAALFYYAGHGVQYEEDNYLLPIDATLASAYALKADAVSLKTLVAELEAVSPVNLIFLDACRDNPLASNLAAGRSAGQIGRGLARVDPTSSNTLIAFAAAPGQVALDGAGRNSPFTSAFLKHVAESDDEISILFKSIARDVLTETNQTQLPQIVSAMTVNFYFQGGAEVTVSNAGSDAQQAYEAAERIGSEQAFQAIVDNFPETVQATLAQAAIAELQRQAEEARGLEREEAAAAEADGALQAEAPTSDATSPTDSTADEADPAEETELALLSPQQVEEALALSRDQRQTVQRALAALGYDPGPADGEFGSRTREAVSRYQAALGEEGTGYLSQEIIRLLEEAPLERGAVKSATEARRYALADIPAGSDPRLTQAIEALGGYELTYDYFEGRLYLAVLSWGLGYEDAQALAERAGGYLVTITSRTENEFVYGLSRRDERFVEFDSDGLEAGPLIGLFQAPDSREPRGGWRWPNGEEVSFNGWESGEPNNYLGVEEIAVLRRNGLWADWEGEMSAFIMEVE